MPVSIQYIKDCPFPNYDCLFNKIYCFKDGKINKITNGIMQYAYTNCDIISWFQYHSKEKEIRMYM